MADSGWLSTKGVAERLGVTSRTVYRFIDEGDLPAYKFGRVIRVKTADVDVFLEACRVDPGSLRHLYPPDSDTSSGDGDGREGGGGTSVCRSDWSSY